jgi:putative membrane protein (TIGR04086 family)
MIQSVRAILWGIFLAVGIGALVVFGIVWPVFEAMFGRELASTALPVGIVVFAATFSFYYGGMIAAYKAPSRRQLHGIMVGVTSFAISPLLNLGASALTANANDPFANLRTPGTMLVTGVLFVVILTSSYVGGRRGESLHAHNEKIARAQERARERRRSREGAES